VEERLELGGAGRGDVAAFVHDRRMLEQRGGVGEPPAVDVLVVAVDQVGDLVGRAQHRGALGYGGG
jgi:hypothetical protein